MKFLRLAIAAVFAFAFGNAYAFHSGGVAECEGCHSMHNSFEGTANVTGLPQFQSGPYLLKAQDQSGACLNCHNAADTGTGSGYHISTDASKLGPGQAPVELTPGGDFAWLKKTYNFLERSSPSVDEGDRHGHNINAVDYGYATDKTQSVAPGGNYPADKLHCSSCHDPHGRYRRTTNVSTGAGTQSTTGAPIFGSGSYPSAQLTASIQATQNGALYPQAGRAAGVYRILGGVGYIPKSMAASAVTPFGNPAPDAMAPNTYNRAETIGKQTHVAYGQGMSEWCANCHPKMLMGSGSGVGATSYTSGMKGLVHPAGNNAKLTPAIVTNYNAYVSSGIMTNTDPKKAYSSLAPFELGTGDYAVLAPLAINADTMDQSASVNSNVMCLSCHRAHASGFESMVRYGLSNEFFTVSDSSGNAVYDPSTTEGKVNRGKTPAEQKMAYYGREASQFGPYARNYCNKCHAKD